MGVPPRYETRISEEPEFWTNTRSIRHWMSMGPERSMVPRLLSHAAIGQASSAARARRARMRALFMFPPFDGNLGSRPAPVSGEFQGLSGSRVEGESAPA